MMKKCWHYLLAIVLLFAVTPTSKAAQVNFTPVLTISGEYTDNLFLDSDDDAKVDDYITTAGLSLATEVLGRTAGFSLNYSPSYSTFADTEDLDYWRHFASLRIWNNFQRNLRLELSSTYLETEDPRDNSGDVDGGQALLEPIIGVDSTRRARTRYSTNVNELRLSNQFGARSSFYGAIGYTVFKDIDPPTGTTVDDYEDVRPSFGIEYWFDQKWGVELDTYYSNRTYEDRDDRLEYFGSVRLLRSFNRRLSGFIEYRHTVLDFDEELTDEDYQLYSPAVGIDYEVGENTNISVGVGYYIQNFDEAEDEEGLIVNSSLLKDWVFRTGYVRLTAGSGYDIADTGAQDLGLNLYYQARLEAVRNFTSRSSGTVYTGYRHDEYPNTVSDRKDQTTNAGVGFNYQVIRWMQIELAYDYSDVASDIETEEYTENSVILTFTFAPSTPYRLN